MSFCISNPKNKYYRYAIKREIQIESKAGISKGLPSIDNHPIINSYINEEIIGKSSTGETDWYDIFIKKYRPVDKGLSLGAGTGRHQKFLISRGFVKKWDSIDLIIHNKDIMGEFSKKMELISGDLNFIELPVNRYPVIFCHGVIHHIINLEHLLFQINNALTSDGLFILCEYVGEKKQQWQEEKLELINKELLMQFGTKYPTLDLEVRRRAILNRRPLESIRSGEIPTLIKRIFGTNTEFEYLGLPLLYPIVNHLSRFNREELLKNPSIFEEILKFSVLLDRETKSNNNILPTLLIGIYHKSQIKNPVYIKPWTNKEIKFNLGSHEPCTVRIKNKLARIEIVKKMIKFRRKGQSV